MARTKNKIHSDGPRRCVGCRQGDEPGRMLRFVVHEKHLWIDVAQKLLGRGAWVHPRQGCMQQGLERGGFQRSLHAPVNDSLERILEESVRVCQDDALRILGLLRRSGTLVFGRDEVKKAALAGKLHALCLAPDAAERTALSVQRLASDKALNLCTVGDREQFGHALGTAPLAVIGLPKGSAGKGATQALWRWSQLLDKAMVYKGSVGA